jgi:hypothetical protein
MAAFITVSDWAGARVRSENRGVGGKTPLEAAQDPVAFALCRRRLERTLAASCDPAQPWAAGAAAAIEAALGFAEVDPVAARVLTVHSAFRRIEGAAPFMAMVEDFAAVLNCGAPPTSRPERTARNIVTRVARQTLLQLEMRSNAPVVEIAPDLIVFALTPYTGFAEAHRWATGS